MRIFPANPAGKPGGTQIPQMRDNAVWPRSGLVRSTTVGRVRTYRTEAARC
jgi:hypothetical protein